MQSSLKKCLPIIALGLAVIASPAAAEDFSPDPDWKISVYLWAAGLEGDVGIGPIQADIDLSFSDLLSDLNFGGSAVARRDWGANMIMGDLTYLSLSPDDVPGPLGGTISSDLDITLLTAYYGRKWGTDKGYGGLLVGGRYMKLALGMDAYLDTPGPAEPQISRRASPDFTDFVIGGMVAAPLGEKWEMMVFGDIGVGGSNNSWQAQMIFQRILQSGNRVSLGARVLSVDFDDTMPNGDLFLLDARMAGAMFGFTWD